MSRYASGRRWEWRVRDHFRSLGYDVGRMAGSKGRYDLVAVDGRHVRFIQVKQGKAKKPAKADLEKLRALVVPDSDVIKKELWLHTNRKGWSIWPVDDEEAPHGPR